MDQSECWVAETPKERIDKEVRAAMGREESEKQARDLQLSCHLGLRKCQDRLDVASPTRKL